jgi:hypothetical protein
LQEPTENQAKAHDRSVPVYGLVDIWNRNAYMIKRQRGHVTLQFPEGKEL